MQTIRIATRASRLALIQARAVATPLEALGRSVEIVTVSTRGDRVTDRSLVQIGGDGVFVKELEAALLDGRADVAVHSMKDLPTDEPAELLNAAVLEREDPRDVLISKDNAYRGLAALPASAVVGTSSLRRQALLLVDRPDVEVRDIRGNVDTRVRKVLEGEFDAAILALAGLRRAGLLETVGGGTPLALDLMTPPAGQGAICAQCRKGDGEMTSLLKGLDHPQSALEVTIERAFLRRMGGGCLVPIGVNAAVRGPDCTIEAVVAAVDGSSTVRRSARVAADDEVSAVAAAESLADEMLKAGGRALVDLFCSTVVKST
ncbi:MAG: hydroxymethylbilane synthase [Candidatus Eremiobacterales bacterium]